ncbi:Tim44 domain-containing protein [Devosia sp.]|uniref:Tim44 domain-containing protein n=1 Tax=Devosia sp. TaxID=1871048 RepID=UPI002F233E21
MYQISLFEYLMVSVAVILSLRVYRAAHPPGAPAEPPAPARPDGVAAGAAGTTAANEEAARLAATLQRLAEGGDGVPALLEGARQAYEDLLAAYAAGDLAGHDHLLAGPIRQAFETALAERQARGETSSLTFIGFHTAEIVAAGVDEAQAWMDVHFVADIVASTRDGAGKVLTGHPTRVTQTDEVWTFERDLAAPASGWRLAATAAAG